MTDQTMITPERNGKAKAEKAQGKGWQPVLRCSEATRNRVLALRDQMFPLPQRISEVAFVDYFIGSVLDAREAEKGAETLEERRKREAAAIAQALQVKL